jgi:hyaluronan synthase
MHQAGPGSPAPRSSSRSSYAKQQEDALAALTALAQPGREDRDYLRPGSDLVHVDLSGRDSRVRRARPARLAPREKAPGALNDYYDIPVVTFRHHPVRGAILTVFFIAGVAFWRVTSGWHHAYFLIIILAAPVFLFKAFNWLLSWKDKPVKLGPRDEELLDQLNVVVTVPVYNEDPALLDRCLYGLVNQSRPPQRIDVVDDGSKLDYTELRHHWERIWPGGTEIHWLRQRNQGKRKAHAKTFISAPEADVFVTVDSDTTLEYRAIEEGLKPFIYPQVMSVAGIEVGFNASKNFLTRMQGSLQMYSQVVMGAAWSVIGDMYTNRGPFALYRAVMVREITPLYRDETFFGRPVILGDDSLLALCAGSRGKAVQQLTAYGLTMLPENWGHHVRQRIRWARGRTVRNFWRVKYRRMNCYIWWYTTLGIYAFLSALGILVSVVVAWPDSAYAAADMLLAMFTWHCLMQLRVYCFHRSDERWSDRLLMMLIRPMSSLWAALVLATLVRAYGTVTCLRQGWTTRQQGAELSFSEEVEREAVA